MKRFVLISVIFSTGILFITRDLYAQGTVTVTTSDKKQTEEIKKVTEVQKSEQQKLQDELKKAAEVQKIEQLKMQEEVKKAGEEVRKVMESENLRHGRVVITNPAEGDYPFNMYISGQNAYGFAMRGPGTSWDFSRTVQENSSSKEYTFEVEKEMKSLSLSISGMCKAGEIRIAVLMPGNKSYSEVVIDEFGNLNWRKSFELNEESKDKIGVWKFKVTTTKASGNFRLSLTAS